MRITASRFLLALLVACGGQTAPARHGPEAAAAAHGHHGGMPHRFDDADRWAKVFDDPARDAWQRPDEVVALLAIAPGMTVVDLGAGTGYFLARLSHAVGQSGHVIATDIEPDMIRYMKERIGREGLGNVEAVLAPAAAPGVAVASADRILIVDVWHHLDDRAAYAAKLAASLKPGGAVFVVDFTRDSAHGPPVEHRLAPEAVIAELAAGGLVAATATETLSDQYVVVGKRAVAPR